MEHGDDLQYYINFAIEKEQEAVDFYNNLASKVHSKAIVQEIMKIKTMEEQHRDRLKNLDIQKLVKENPQAAANMKIAESVVIAKPTANMSWQDLLSIAMHREMESMNLYKFLAKKMSTLSVVKLFQQLARDESEHKLFFERIWDQDILKEN